MVFKSLINASVCSRSPFDINTSIILFIDSNFNYNGKLTYADFYIKGKVKQEIFFSS